MFFRSISAFFYQISKGLLVAAALLLFLLFVIFVLPKMSSQAESYSTGAGTPDTSLFYSPAALVHMAEMYGPEGRRAYVHARFTFDLAFPLIYTFFLITSISRLLDKRLAEDSSRRMLNLLPLVAMLLDLLENVCAAWVIGSYPVLHPTIAFLAVIFTPLKWLAVTSSFLVLGIAFCMEIITRIKPHAED